MLPHVEKNLQHSQCHFRRRSVTPGRGALPPLGAAVLGFGYDS
jgi:hypothetical protein